ncbi:ribonuclease H-like domain-containing protein [Tanacetum coccineum]
MPSIPTQSPFTYPNPNPSASPSFTQDDTSDSFIPEPTQPIPTYTQPAFSQPAFSQPAFSQPNQSFFSQPAVHLTQPSQTNPNNVQSQQFQQFQTATISANNAKFPYLEKEKYEIWAMKMEYWIQNADHNLWRIVSARKHPKRKGKKEGHIRANDRFLEDSTILNQVQARPDNDDINLKFLRALPSSWSQVGLALKTRAIVVKASVSPTHSAKCFLRHSFVSENKQDQDMTMKTLTRFDQLEMVLRRRQDRKMNYNNQQPRFDRRKVRCYKCLQLGHFARECNVKTVDDKARYSAFKVTEVKTDEPKALVSVDSMVNWSDHAAENKTGEVEKVYGMMAGLHADNGGAGVSNAADEFAMMGISPKVQNCPLGCDSKINDLNHMYNNLDRLYNDCYIKVQAYQHAVKTLESQKDWYHKTQIALEEKIRVLSANLENTTNTLSYTEKLHDQAQNEKKEWEVKYEATLARFDKWKESSKNLNKLINSSMSTRTKIGLGLKEYFGKDEVFDLSSPSVMNPETVTEAKPLYSWFVKAGEMHAVPPSITGTYMPSPYKSDIEETQVMTSLQTKRPMHPVIQASRLRPAVNSVCGSKLHLIKDCDFYNCVDSVPCKSKAASVPAGSKNSPASVPAGGSDPAASGNRPAVNSAGRPNPAGWSKRPATVSAGSRNSPASVTAGGSDPAASRNRPAVIFAGRRVSAGWLNPAARPYFRPSSIYFNNMYWPDLYDPMYMNKGRWGTAVKTSAGYSWRNKRPHF